MTTLILQDRGYAVATSAWTAAAKPGGRTEVAYLWGEDGVSWFDSATGVSRATLELSIEDFLARLGSASVLDLRAFCVS